MFGALRFGCVVLFSVSIPLLVVARYRLPQFPAWLLIVIATAVGWLLPFAYTSMRQPMMAETYRAEILAQEEYLRHPPPPIRNPDGSVTVENPFGIGDYAPEYFHSVVSVLYGPVYLMGCWLAGWLLYRGGASRLRTRCLFVSVAALLAEWMAFMGKLIQVRPPAMFSDEVFIDGWNPFFGPQLTVPLAGIIAWLLVAGIPAAITAVFKRPVVKGG